jgi:hypothetical protein
MHIDHQARPKSQTPMRSVSVDTVGKAVGDDLHAHDERARRHAEHDDFLRKTS